MRANAGDGGSRAVPNSRAAAQVDNWSKLKQAREQSFYAMPRWRLLRGQVKPDAGASPADPRLATGQPLGAVRPHWALRPLPDASRRRWTHRSIYR
jgi:hypothetical protein